MTSSDLIAFAMAAYAATALCLWFAMRGDAQHWRWWEFPLLVLGGPLLIGLLIVLYYAMQLGCVVATLVWRWRKR